MASTTTALQQRIESGKPILIVETSPPSTSDPEAVRALARRFAGKVHSLGISDNRDGVCMAALAAAALVAQEGVEPIQHVVTRDRNRIALMSDTLGAKALGVRNFLCTSGTHQTLGASRAARNVYDLDSVQMLQALAGDGCCLGGVVAPFADPPEMQVARAAKKIKAGARFLITEPVYDLERFTAWWREITRRGLHQQVAFIAGVRIMTDANEAQAQAARRPDPRIPASVLTRLGAKSDNGAQRAEGLAIALETIQRLMTLEGLRGIELRAEGAEEAVLEIIERLHLGID